MKVRHIGDLNRLVAQLENQWEATTDTNTLLQALLTPVDNENVPTRLLMMAANGDIPESCRPALQKLLSLVTLLAKNEKTDINQLLTLLADMTKPSMSNIATWIFREHPSVCHQYLEIIRLIAAREHLSEENCQMLRKLIVHHDQRGQDRGHEKDGSIIFDLVAHEYDNGDHGLLNNYLTMLLNLAEAGRIDSNTIYNALRTPLGSNRNIGTNIANTYSRPDTFLAFIKLCDKLEPSQVDQLFPRNWNDFYNERLKERVCEKIENLESPDEIIAMCTRARDKDTPLGRFMHFKRGSNECSEKRGANGRIRECYAKALIAREEQHHLKVKAMEKAPRPSAPVLDEPEFMQLFNQADKRDYEKYIKRASQQFHFKNAEEANKALRYAAAYGHNEDLVILLKDHKVDVNTHNDVGDMCLDATALYLAVEQNNVEGVRILLEHQADPNLARRLGVTPLCFAAINGNVEIAKMLLKHGAEVNVVSRYKNSPLYFAARMGHPEMINFLIEHYRQSHDKSIDELVKFLQKNSQLTRCIQDAENGAVILALANLIDFLAEKGVDQTVLDAMIPQSYAFRNRHLKESLKDAIAELGKDERIATCNKILKDSNSLLHKIVWMKRGGLLGKPCRSGAGVIKDIEDIHAIATDNAQKIFNDAYHAYEATTGSNNDLSALEQALKDGADISKVNKHQHILGMAAVRNDVRMIELALKYGANAASPCRKHVDIIRQAVEGHHKGMDRFEAYQKECGDAKIVHILPEKIAELCKSEEAASLLRKHREAAEAKQAESNHDNVTVAEPAQTETAAPQADEAVPDPRIEEVVVAAEETPPPSYEEAMKITPVAVAQTARLYPVVEQVTVPVSDALQRYLDLAAANKPAEQPVAQIAVESKPAPQTEPQTVTVINPITGEPLPRAAASEQAADPLTAIDALLNAPAAPKQPSWLAGLDEIDFSPSAMSSTAVVMQQMVNLISFEEPVSETPYINPFDELVGQEKQPVAAKAGYQNPFDEMTEDQRDAHVAAQLDALPPAPTGLGLFAARLQEASKTTEKSKKMMVAN